MVNVLPALKGKNRILVAVLHWGLGHAARCIPLIQYLVDNGKTVATAGDSESIALLRRAFPRLDSFELPSYDIQYNGHNMVSSMIRQSGKLFTIYQREKKTIRQLVKKWSVEVIISDNRFGALSKGTLNIYLTHQLNIQHKSKFIAKIANLIHRRFIQSFDICWVPDYSDHRLSGKLSDSTFIKIPVSYIGSLTRFELKLGEVKNDILILLSGPEPARTVLEKIMISKFRNETHKRIILVRGVKKNRQREYPKHISVIDIADQVQLQLIIEESAYIICRSGYSTIMDLQRYDRPKYFIPTPGQTEQEYLAQLHHKKNRVTSLSQNSIDRFEFPN